MKLPTYKEVWYFGLKLLVPIWVKCIATDKCGEIWGYGTTSIYTGTTSIYTGENSWRCDNSIDMVLIFENVDMENIHWTESKIEVE